MYETEVSWHTVIESPNSQKTMITKNWCVSYITTCRKTKTPNSIIFQFSCFLKFIWLCFMTRVRNWNAHLFAKMAGRSFLVNSDPLPPPIRFFYKENVNFYSGCSFSSDPPRLRANLLFKWSIRRHIPYPYHFHPLPLEFSWGVWPLNFSDFAPKCHPMCPHSYPVCRSLHNIQFQILRHGFLKSFR
jgi:hypothetical protein